MKQVLLFFYICLIFFHFKKLPIYGKYELGLAKCVLNATRKTTLIVDKRKTEVHNIIIIQHNCILQHMQKKPKKQTMRVRSHSSSTVLVVQQVKRHHRCQPSTSRSTTPLPAALTDTVPCFSDAHLQTQAVCPRACYDLGGQDLLLGGLRQAPPGSPSASEAPGSASLPEGGLKDPPSDSEGPERTNTHVHRRQEWSTSGRFFSSGRSFIFIFIYIFIKLLKHNK